MGSPHGIFLVLSAGRCGTQWLAANLADSYGDRLDVAHEPLGPFYRPREFFRAYDRLAELGALPEVAAHLDRVERVVESRSYVETGWPLFAAIPLFIQRFGCKVRLIHLTRHPVPNAISHMVHQCYAGSPRDDPYTRLAALDPFCPGVFQGDYGARWESLTPYEKCLFWWTEVHQYAGEIAELHPDQPVIRLKSEDLLASEQAQRSLTTFLELPYGFDRAARRRDIVDEWHHRTRLDFDWRQIFEHPATLQVAAQLGYDPEEIDARLLEERYRGEPHLRERDRASSGASSTRP